MLTQCIPVMPYGAVEFGHHWFRKLLGAEHMMTDCHRNPHEQISVKFERKYKCFR